MMATKLEKVSVVPVSTRDISGVMLILAQIISFVSNPSYVQWIG